MFAEALGFEYARVFSIPGFWIYQTSEHVFRFEYGRFIQGIEYAWLCLNVPKSVWMAFVLHLPIVIPYLKES